MKLKRVCVIGSGNGAFAVAGNLALRGYAVILWDCDEFQANLDALICNGNRLKVTGESLTGIATLEKVTGDLRAAMDESDVILVVIPSFAFEKTAKKIAEYAQPGAKIFLCAGSTGGALEFARIFKDASKKGILLGEYATLPYGCKKTSPVSVNIATDVKDNLFAAFPAKYNNILFEYAKELFPITRMAETTLECSLNNGNIVIHGPIMVFNAAGTEKNPDNYHYRDGVTPSVSRVLDKLDNERLSICKELGYNANSLAEIAVRRGYCPRLEKSTYETIRGSGDFMASKGPTTLNHRYLTEDIPYSALVVSELGRILCVPTPLTDAVVALGEALIGENYQGSGRTAKSLGIEGMDKNRLMQYLNSGYY